MNGISLSNRNYIDKKTVLSFNLPTNNIYVVKNYKHSYMATYEKYILNLGPYQEGNLSDIEFQMDSSFDMTDVGVSFEVRNDNDRIIIRKTSDDGDIDISGQNITSPLNPEDTKRNSGVYKYEIDFINSSSQPFATIGGNFTISKEVNKT
jgi:hypothetical protein